MAQKALAIDAKRLIGQKYNNPELQEDFKDWPFKVVNCNNLPQFQVTYQKQKKNITPEEVSALVLANMKQIAEDYLGMPVESAVITVPAYFNDLQRNATKDAAQIAGLNVLRILNEPTSAALAYGYGIDRKDKKNVLVYDLGGGTFDVSILSIDDTKFKVIATGGNTHLGGVDFDRRIVNHFISEIRTKYKKDISINKKALSKLRKACEVAKRSLSSQSIAKIYIESLYDKTDFNSSISAVLFDEINADLYASTIFVLMDTLNDAKLNKEDIDEIVLVGGSTRILKIQVLIKEFFEKSPLKSINPDEAVAAGACIAAAILNNNDSAVIMNALLEEVTPLSLGVQLRDGSMSVLIKRNSKIPTNQKKCYTTTKNNQKGVCIQIAQGEATQFAKNIVLGHLKLPNVTPAPLGMQKLAVTFSIDTNGILKVSATFLSTGKGAEFFMNTKSNLSKETVDLMVKQAANEKKEEMEMKEVNQVKNQLHTLCSKMISDLRESKTPLEEDILYECQKNLCWLVSSVTCNKEAYEERIHKIRALMSKKIFQLD